MAEITPRRVLVAFVGAGLIGTEVLRLLSTPLSQATFTVVSISNSTHVITQAPSQARLSADELLALLPASTSSARPSHPLVSFFPASTKTILNTLITLHKSTPLPILLIDCTASLPLCTHYPAFLTAGISIVTPNKKAFSSGQHLWEQIEQASRGDGAGWLYLEGTVGAGLPVVQTVRDLALTGDEVMKVEGIMSGTLSAVWNAFSRPGGRGAGIFTFSEAVRMARDAGLTEPNPAEDLAGIDVARKLTILVRLAALGQSTTPLPILPEGYKSLQTESLIPPPLASISDGNEFLARLCEHDADFTRLRDEAEAANEVIRYVGTIDRDTGVISCGLRRYPSAHPFAALEGSENIVTFYTKRYGHRPLIMQGPADHTAAGVLSDAFRMAERCGFGTAI